MTIVVTENLQNRKRYTLMQIVAIVGLHPESARDTHVCPCAYLLLPQFLVV